MRFSLPLSLWFGNRSIHKKVWKLAGPMILSNLSVPLIYLVDSAVVGHLPHAYQLGAVTAGGGLYLMIANLFMFLRMATTGFTAQAIGQSHPNPNVPSTLILIKNLVLALAFTILIGLLAYPIIQATFWLMSPSADLMREMQVFFLLRLLGLPATLSTYVLIGWFLGRQNAKVPLVILLTTNIFNAVLVISLVHGLHWGVAGSAVAAVIAEWISLFIGANIAFHLTKRAYKQIDWQALWHWNSWCNLLRVSRDIFLRSLALQVVFFTMTVEGTRLGDSTVAANGLIRNGLFICAFALDGLAHAIESLCGYAIGAKDQRSLLQAFATSTLWAFIVSVFLTVLALFYGDMFINVQTDIPSVRTTAYHYLPYLASLPLVCSWSYVLDGLFVGATRTSFMRNGMLIALACSIPLGWLLLPLGNHGIWLTFLFFMSVRALLSAYFAINITRHNRWFTPAHS